VASFVTDRPTEEGGGQVLSSLVPASTNIQDILSHEGVNSPELINASFSPEYVRPFRKAGP
jgi:hypothetical protein